MATSMLSPIASEKLHRFVKLFVKRHLMKNVNTRVYCSVQDDKNDFFGIPEDFELQHYRHSASGKSESEVKDEDAARGVSTAAPPKPQLQTKYPSPSGDLPKANRTSEYREPDLVGEYHHKPGRRARRHVRQMDDYKTNFGIVSIDRRATPSHTDSGHGQFKATEDFKIVRNSENLPSGEIFQPVLKPSHSCGHRTTISHSITDSVSLPPNSRSNSHYDYESLGNIGSDRQSTLNTQSETVSDHYDNKHRHRQYEPNCLSPIQHEASLTSAERTYSPFMDRNLNEIDSQNFQSDFPHSTKSSPVSDSSIRSNSGDYAVGESSKPVHISPSLKIENSCDTNASKSSAKNNIFDEYYFPELSADSKNQSVQSDNQSTFDNDSAFNAIDDQYFGKAETSAPESFSVFSEFASEYDINKDGSPTQVQDLHPQKPPTTKTTESFLDNKANIVTNTSDLLNKTRAEMKQNEEQSTSAFDLAMKIRLDMMKDPNNESTVESLKLSPSDKSDSSSKGITKMTKGRVDSKGFRILSDQVSDFSKIPSMDILEMLKKRIVFDHEDFLVIDKPFGLPAIGQMHDTHSLSSLLSAFGRSLPRKYKASDLHIVQGLDRDVSGNIMLAKNPEISYILKGMFKHNEVIQSFWAITKGVPSPRRGIIDIPIGVGQVGSVYKMVLRPQYTINEKPDGKKRSKAPCERAITEYNVLSSHLQAALVECRLNTAGVKHQVRVHLSSGLNTPILGDHKYSHFSKLAPQKLDRSTLELLKVRQAKVRHISLHLHCHSLVLPDYKSRTYVITSHLPSFFSQNMKSLKLYLPKN